MLNRRELLQSAALALTACGAESAPQCKSGQATGCAAPGVPGKEYFEQLKSDLNALGYGTPQVVIDLDRLEANADAIAQGVGANRYRIVEKSLPSLDLLEFVSKRTGSNRFMVMHLPFLAAVLDRFPAGTALMGKAQPIAAVKTLLDQRPDLVSRVTFLADTKKRAEELVALQRNVNVAIEVDTGLHRGGVRKPSLLKEVAEVISGGGVTFVGLMGYDGHCIGAPALPGLDEPTVRATFNASLQSFQKFIDALKKDAPELWRDDLILSSGGTNTFPLYPEEGPVNDVAAGGGMLRPAAYSPMFTSALSPALFTMVPVLEWWDKLELPWISRLTDAISDESAGLTVYSAGLAGDLVYPPGLSWAPLVSGGENGNLVPNTSWLAAPPSPKLGPGDWVFQHSREADMLFLFEEILLVRGGRIQTEKWKAFPRRL